MNATALSPVVPHALPPVARPIAAALAQPYPAAGRDAALREHRPLVRRIAGRLRPRLPAHVDLDELMQAGMIGLNDAITRYSDRRGASFETFASRRIQGAMLDQLRSLDHLSRDQRARQRELRAAVHRLEQQLGRPPRAKEVADALGWTMEAFHRCMVDAGQGALRAGDTRLEPPPIEVSPAAHDEDDDDADRLDEHADPVLAVQRRQRQAALMQALDGLTEREQQVMTMLYDQGLRQQDVAAALGVSGSRISRLHDEIVEKLRRRLRDW